MTAVTAREMRHRLRRKFEAIDRNSPMPRYLVMFEVPVDGVRAAGTPREWVSRQRIDAVAVGIFKKTEHLIHGFEIKVSRSDLLAELRDPEKSAASVRAVDRWWLALGDPAILKDSDPVPESWGVIATSGRGLSVVREPSPQPGECDRRFIAAMLQSSFRAHGACRGLAHQRGYLRGLGDGEHNAEARLRQRIGILERAVRSQTS